MIDEREGRRREAPEDDTCDLRRLVSDNGWSVEQIASFRSMCAVAAAKESVAIGDREFAAAIVACLDGRSPGISPSQLGILARADLISL
jgi:hypothetical protein